MSSFQINWGIPRTSISPIPGLGELGTFEEPHILVHRSERDFPEAARNEDASSSESESDDDSNPVSSSALEHRYQPRQPSEPNSPVGPASRRSSISYGEQYDRYMQQDVESNERKNEELLQHTRRVFGEDRQTFRLRNNYDRWQENAPAPAQQDLSDISSSTHPASVSADRLPKVNMKSDIRPKGFTCPLSDKLFHDPVFTKCRHVFERYSIELQFNGQKKIPCPSCSKNIEPKDIKSHAKLKKLIEQWCSKNNRARNDRPALPKIKLSSPDAPNEIICPIMQDVMETPFYTVNCQHAFEAEAIRRWINGDGISAGKNTCPTCRSAISIDGLKPWPALKALIKKWQDTPKVEEGKQTTAQPSSGTTKTRRSQSVKNKPTAHSSRATSAKRSQSIKNKPAAQSNNSKFSQALAQAIVTKSLLHKANLIDPNNPNKIPTIDQLPDRFPGLRKDFQLAFGEIFGNVYSLYRKQKGKTPSNPDFGRKAFYHQDHLNVSQAIRQQAIHLFTLKQIGKLFQNESTEKPAMKMFSSLPEGIRKGTYQQMLKVLKGRKDGRSYTSSPSYGRDAFLRINQLSASPSERAKAIEYYLKSKL